VVRVIAAKKVQPPKAGAEDDAGDASGALVVTCNVGLGTVTAGPLRATLGKTLHHRGRGDRMMARKFIILFAPHLKS
jgi:hypothetical protein